MYRMPVRMGYGCVQMYGCVGYIMHHMVTRKGTEKSTMKP